MENHACVYKENQKTGDVLPFSQTLEDLHSFLFLIVQGLREGCYGTK